jgi:hypothetical protein
MKVRLWTEAADPELPVLSLVPVSSLVSQEVNTETSNEILCRLHRKPPAAKSTHTYLASTETGERAPGGRELLVNKQRREKWQWRVVDSQLTGPGSRLPPVAT